MPTYNWLSRLSGTIGNGINNINKSITGVVNQPINESIFIQTSIRPDYIAIIYGKDAERALLIYDKDYSTTSYWFSNTSEYLQIREFGTSKFHIESIEDNGFTLAPTDIATENAIIYYFVMEDGANSLLKMKGKIQNVTGTSTIYFPDTIEALALFKVNGTMAMFYTSDRSTTGVAAATNTQYSKHAGLALDSENSIGWGTLDNNKFMVSNTGGSITDYYYFGIAHEAEDD